LAIRIPDVQPDRQSSLLHGAHTTPLTSHVVTSTANDSHSTTKSTGGLAYPSHRALLKDSVKLGVLCGVAPLCNLQ